MIKHYLSNGTLIRQANTGGYGCMYDDGCFIYMKKGEYITVVREANVGLQFSRFWYAEGCQPDSEE